LKSHLNSTNTKGWNIPLWVLWVGVNDLGQYQQVSVHFRQFTVYTMRLWPTVFIQMQHNSYIYDRMEDGGWVEHSGQAKDCKIDTCCFHS